MEGIRMAPIEVLFCNHFLRLIAAVEAFIDPETCCCILIVFASLTKQQKVGSQEGFVHLSGVFWFTQTSL